MDKFNPFKKKETDVFEKENRPKLVEIFHFIKELANDSIFADHRKKYHTQGTNDVNLIDNISRRFMAPQEGSTNEAQEELLKILEATLVKAESINDNDVEKIKRIISLVKQPDIFSRSDINNKAMDDVGLFKHEPQMTITDHTRPPVEPNLN